MRTAFFTRVRSDGIWIHSSTQGPSELKCVESIHHKASDSGGKCALLLLLYRHIGLLFGKRLDTNLLRYRVRKYPDSPVHMLSVSLLIYFVPLWLADLKIYGFAPGRVWTEALSGACTVIS